MGGLRQHIPWTHRWFLTGVLAIAGFPFFSGFFSKDEILLSAYLAHGVPGHQALYALALATAGAHGLLHVPAPLPHLPRRESRAGGRSSSHVHDPNAVDPGAARRARRALGLRRLARPLGRAEPRSRASMRRTATASRTSSRPVLHGVHHEVSFATERWLAAGAVAVAGLGALLAALALRLAARRCRRRSAWRSRACTASSRTSTTWTSSTTRSSCARS